MNMDFLKPRMGGTATAVSSNSSPMMPVQQVSGFNKAIKWCLFAIVLITPLFFLTITSEFREFNKQALIILGTLVVTAIWMIKALVSRRLTWVKSPLDWAVLGYLAIYLISTIFSLDKSSSFIGYSGRYVGSFISVLSLVLLYFVITNNSRSENSSKWLAKAIFFGSGLTLIYSLLQILGLYVLPVEKAASFNTVGSLSALSIFAAASVLFYQWKSFSVAKSTASRVILGVLSLVGLVVMFLVNAFTGWLILLLGMILLLSLGAIAKQNENQTWFWQPMLVLVISVLFVAFSILPSSINPRNLVKVNLPLEINLSNKTTWTTVANTLSFSKPKQAVFGTGPGTVGIAFGQIKPEVLNKTIVWNVNFDRVSSEIGNIAIETGLIGLIAFEALSIIFLIYAIRSLMKKSEKSYALGFFIVWAALYIAHFLYFFNTTFWLLFWVSMAGFVASVHDYGEAEESVSAPSARNTISWMFGSLLILAVILVGIFFEASVYVAETSYASGLKTLNQSNPNFDQATSDFARAASLNPYSDTYDLATGQSLIYQASVEAAKQQPDVNKVAGLIDNAVKAGQRATQISASKASNWSALAQFYESIRQFGVGGTEQAAVKNWQEAINRDPNNPVLYVRLAQAYVNASATIDFANLGTGVDADHDGLTDDNEKKLGSDPNKPDTNNNGTNDGDEVKAGLNPNATGALTNAQVAALTKVDDSMLKNAEDTLNKAIAIKSDLPDSYIALARVYVLERKDANKVLDDAISQFPYNPDLRFEKGRITFNNGKFDDAAKIFNDVLKLSPNYSNAIYSLGLIDIQKGNKQAALDKMQKVRDLSGPNVTLDKLISDLKAQITPATPPPAQPNQ